MAKPDGKLKYRSIIRLRCPYCEQTPLLRQGSWFQFDHGCQVCDYSYEREPGYFTGASWMVNYTVSAIFGCGLAAFSLYRFPAVDALVTAGGVSIFLVVFGLWFVPYSMALWLLFDHTLHPLTENEQYRQIQR